VLEETRDRDQIIQRVAASGRGQGRADLLRAGPGPGRVGPADGRRSPTYQTMTRWLLVMADRLRELGVTRVVMEATSDDWKGVYYLLEAHGFETWLGRRP
jgi:transposase